MGYPPWNLLVQGVSRGPLCYLPKVAYEFWKQGGGEGFIGKILPERKESPGLWGDPAQVFGPVWVGGHWSGITWAVGLELLLKRNFYLGTCIFMGGWKYYFLRKLGLKTFPGLFPEKRNASQKVWGLLKPGKPPGFLGFPPFGADRRR